MRHRAAPTTTAARPCRRSSRFWGLEIVVCPRFLLNRLIHGYFDIDTEVVWRTVKSELPELASAIESALQG